MTLTDIIFVHVVETSANVISNSPSQDYTHPDDHDLCNENDVYSVRHDRAILGKRKSKCSSQESNLRPSNITSLGALPLSYRRLVGAKPIKLGSWDKHPVYC